MVPYAFVENNLIFITENLEDIPQNVQYIEVDTSDPKDLKIENGAIVEKPQEEVLAFAKQKAIEELNLLAYQRLSKTDWCVIKCTELNVPLSDLYPEVAQERLAIRNLFTDLKQQVLESSNVEEIEGIVGQAKTSSE